MSAFMPLGSAESARLCIMHPDGAWLQRCDLALPMDIRDLLGIVQLLDARRQHRLPPTARPHNALPRRLHKCQRKAYSCRLRSGSTRQAASC